MAAIKVVLPPPRPRVSATSSGWPNAPQGERRVVRLAKRAPQKPFLPREQAEGLARKSALRDHQPFDVCLQLLNYVFHGDSPLRRPATPEVQNRVPLRFTIGLIGPLHNFPPLRINHILLFSNGVCLLSLLGLPPSVERVSAGETLPGPY